MCIRDRVKHYPLPVGATLAAVGGYGRGELYPHSDVDLLILLPHAPTAEDESAIERLVASLWDLGLEPGHSAVSYTHLDVYKRQSIHRAGGGLPRTISTR